MSSTALGAEKAIIFISDAHDAVGKFIRSEMENMQTHIVYISSKESYAMQLFKVQPLDFLIKPISVG